MTVYDTLTVRREQDIDEDVVNNKTRRRLESAYICQVHDNVMMYTSTRLHTRLPSNVRVQ